MVHGGNEFKILFEHDSGHTHMHLTGADMNGAIMVTIWTTQNKVIFEGLTPDIHQAIHTAGRYGTELYGISLVMKMIRDVL